MLPFLIIHFKIFINGYESLLKSNFIMELNNSAFLILFIFLLLFHVSKFLQTNKTSERRLILRNLFSDRLSHIEQVCSEERARTQNLTSYRPSLEFFSIEEKHKILYCRTAKTGSSTWGHYFVQLYTNG